MSAVTIAYARTATEGGRVVAREERVTALPGRVCIRKFRDGRSRPGHGLEIRTRFPAFTAWRVGRALRRDGYVRRG